jgi:sugar phosphate isomerase/epimerase
MAARDELAAGLGQKMRWRFANRKSARWRERPIDLLLERIPELEWECDLGWLAWAGVDPATQLRTRSRITALHMRDITAADGDREQ